LGAIWISRRNRHATTETAATVIERQGFHHGERLQTPTHEVLVYPRDAVAGLRNHLLPQEAPYAGQCALSIVLAPALGAPGRCSALLVCQMVPFKVRSRQRLSSLTANST
jgi:hypothetical protein